MEKSKRINSVRILSVVKNERKSLNAIKKQ